MKLNKDFLRCNDLGLLVLRLTMGGLMLFHGVLGRITQSR